MAPELPQPSPALLDWLSPTLANELLACGYRVAWRGDSVFSSLGRPSTYSELGLVAHAVIEDASKGRFLGGDEEKARAAVEEAWTHHVERASTDLSTAWAPAAPPTPEEWPGYHLTKARVLRRALRRPAPANPAPGNADAEHSGPPLIEQELRDGAARLRGRPDRVEGSPRARRVVDLKVGLAQAEPTPAQLRQLMLYSHLVEAATDDHVSEIAIEDASGRRWTQPFDHEAADALVGEISEKRSAYEDARAVGNLASLAAPSADTCRWCPFRVACRPYWSSLQSTWGHGSVLGTVDRALPATDGSILEINAESPADSAGSGWIVSLAPIEVAVVGTSVAVTGAEVTGAERHLRWRWSVVANALA